MLSILILSWEDLLSNLTDYAFGIFTQEKSTFYKEISFVKKADLKNNHFDSHPIPQNVYLS